MECYIPSAKILSYEKLPDKKLRKYTYFDTQTGIKDSFLSDKKVIEKGIEELQKKDLTKYFRHCLNYDFSKNEQQFCTL